MGNRELDQLAGRLTKKKGQFGLLVYLSTGSDRELMK
jgi:hypothetical protein